MNLCFSFNFIGTNYNPDNENIVSKQIEELDNTKGDINQPINRIRQDGTAKDYDKELSAQPHSRQKRCK